MGDESTSIAVLSNANASALKIVPAVGGDGLTEGLIGLRTTGGRFLRICHRPSSMVSSLQPSPYCVVAERRDEPGEEGLFLPVCCQARETDPLLQNTPAVHNYPEESVGFWNPLYRVFLRVNEQGAMDCSPIVNSIAQGTVLPAGWDWERFTLQKPTTPDSIMVGKPVK